MNELKFAVLSNFSLLFAILIFVLMFINTIISQKIIPKNIESIPKQIKMYTIKLYITATIFVFAFMILVINVFIAFNQFNVLVLINILCWLYVTLTEIKILFVTMASIRILESIILIEEDFME